MISTDQSVVAQLLFPVITTAFFVLGVAGLVVGIGLIVSSPAMFRFFSVMNRWISLRRPLKPLEVPRDLDPVVGRNRVVLGVLLTVGALVSLYGLLVRIDSQALATALRFDLPGAYVVWLVDSLRWFLIVGSVLALAVGVLLLVSPRTLAPVLSTADYWYSTRQAAAGAEKMNLALDNWVRDHPRAAGWVIVAGALVVVVNFGLLLIGGR
jgi:hypothetical protein